MDARGYEFLPYEPGLYTPPGDASCYFRAPARRVRKKATVTAVVTSVYGKNEAKVAVEVAANNG
jgi:hypothetical protein